MLTTARKYSPLSLRPKVQGIFLPEEARDEMGRVVPRGGVFDWQLISRL